MSKSQGAVYVCIAAVWALSLVIVMGIGHHRERVHWSGPPRQIIMNGVNVGEQLCSPSESVHAISMTVDVVDGGVSIGGEWRCEPTRAVVEELCRKGSE